MCKIKPLEWIKSDEIYKASWFYCTYKIVLRLNTVDMTNRYVLTACNPFGQELFSEYFSESDIEKAKEFAESHYQELIKNCLL